MNLTWNLKFEKERKKKIWNVYIYKHRINHVKFSHLFLFYLYFVYQTSTPFDGFIRLEITKQSVYLGFKINKDIDNNYLDNNSLIII